MIKELRKKFVLVFMSVTTVFLAALLVCLYLLSAATFRQHSNNMLRDALKNTPPDNSDLPYAVIEVHPDGNYDTKFTHMRDFSPEEIDGVIQYAKGPRPHFMGEKGDLRFQMHRMEDNTTRIAMADTRFEQQSLKSQAIHSIWIGIGIFLGFLVFSIYLSGWIVRPVEEAWNRQRQFVSNASHELKTPLTIALSNLDLALNASQDQDKNPHRLELARSELTRMKGLTERLLELARADALEPTSQISEAFPIDLSYLLECAAASFEPILFESGKKLAARLTPEVTVFGQEEKLQELADILLDNAVKYSSPGSTVVLSLKKDEKGVFICVENDGIPLTHEQQAHLFDRFYRADTSREKIPGYGLGLSIARKTVSQMNGSIWVESTPEGHTAFHVKLKSK